MSKAILISIKPKWVAKILNGEKTIEIRKSIPKCNLPIDVYVYCTKGKQILKGLIAKSWYGLGGYFDYEKLNGKVVAKFTLNKIRTSDMTNCLQGSCLSYDEVNEYTKGKKFYGWVIDNLEVFDVPRELREFSRVLGTYECNHNCEYCDMAAYSEKLKRFIHECEILKAPQSWCYMEI